MGEAIARFREMALAIRRICDERHSQPRWAVKAAAAEKFAKECRLHLLDHEKTGMNYPERYVRGLCRRRDEAERHRESPPSREWFDLTFYIDWVPEQFKTKVSGASEHRKALRHAIKEAVQYGSLFEVVEARIKALDAAAEKLSQYAAPNCFESPAEEYWHVDDETGTACGREPTKAEADRDYIARHKEFAEALDALAPFIEEPPADTGSSPKQKTSPAKQATKRSRKGVGGRPAKFTEDFIREMGDARRRDEKHAAKAKRPLPRVSEWLSDYFTNVKKLPLSTLPSKKPEKPEEWSIRANRFWKAATKRVREAETNRH